LSSITDPVVKNNISIINEKPWCIYPLAKLHRLPFFYSTHHTSQPFEIVHCDLWVPCFIPSYDGFKYFLTLVDCFTRSIWLYLLPTKADTKRNIECFANLVENQFNRKIKILRSDNGGNFTWKIFSIPKALFTKPAVSKHPNKMGL
jgi:histone deacetylase 1/2